MAYLGNTPTTQSFISGTDYFNGTGSQTAFTLSRTVASINDIQVTVNNVVQQPNDAYTSRGTTLTMTSAPSAGTNNVYVRYLSTTTQAITPSQGTVSWSTLNSDVQQDLGISYKNRIINGNMVIDQRNAGASVTASTTGTGQNYTLDRFFYWVSQASKMTIQQNAGSVTPPAGFTNYLGVTSSAATSLGSSDYFLIGQAIEGFNTADLDFGKSTAKTVTLSFWVRSSLTGTFGGALQNSTPNRSYPFSYTISSANTWEQKSITIAGDTTGTWTGATNGVGAYVWFGLGLGSTYSGTAGVWNSSTPSVYSATGATSVVGTNGATWYITGVQLEVGTQATTFTTAGGSYGAELALCQRYYYRLGTSISGSMYGVGWNVTTTQALALITFPVTMRTAPSALEQSGTASDYAVYHGGGSGATCNAVPAFGVANTQNCRFLLTVASGLTANGGSMARAENNNSYLGFSAEL